MPAAPQPVHSQAAALPRSVASSTWGPVPHDNGAPQWGHLSGADFRSPRCAPAGA